MSVLLGIDLGERRIGVAAGDTESGVVTPLLTLRRSTAEHDARAIARVCRERGASRLVVGLPLHMDGSESEQSARTRAWVASLAPMLALPVTLRDERMSSHDAEERMGRPPRGRSGGPPSTAARRSWRARIDREAAAVIVQNELDASNPTSIGATQ